MIKLNLFFGAAVSSWLLAAMVIVSELVHPFKEVLAATFTHHWIGKGVIMAIVFIAAGFLLRDKERLGNYSDDDVGFYSVLGSLLLIAVFYIIEFIR